MLLTWQGIVVLCLLLLPVIFAQLIRAIPRDLLFTIAALLSALCGIISSRQIFQACFNPATFTIFGLWMIGKAMQQQGVFHTCMSFFPVVKRNYMLHYVSFFCLTILCGAFLNHRYFPLSVLRDCVRYAEKKRGDLSIYGFPFATLLLIGGLTTAIGTPTNILLVSLYSLSKREILSDFFVFLPFSLLPLLLTSILLYLFKEWFRKPFLQFIDAGSCGVVPPDSLLIGKAHALATIREGKLMSKKAFVQSGDLILLPRTPSRVLHSQMCLFMNGLSATVRWKKMAIIFLFLGAIVTILTQLTMGTTFLIASLFLLVIHPFPLQKTFREEFPLPLLLEMFSAYLFFFALQNSGLNVWFGAHFPFRIPLLILAAFFLFAQMLGHFMPRPLAFAVLFSIASTRFADQPIQLLLLGLNIAYATAIPLFGTPLLDEMAIATAISGKTALSIRALLMVILFGSIVIPMSFFWPQCC